CHVYDTLTDPLSRASMFRPIWKMVHPPEVRLLLNSTGTGIATVIASLEPHLARSTKNPLDSGFHGKKITMLYKFCNKPSVHWESYPNY
ncbi:MAG TPA: hypothetical protein VF780_04045, partial [Nitrosospira sp.]